jgi:hypothetical protein
MKIRECAVAALLTLMAAGCVAAQPAEDAATASALKMVESTRLGDNLMVMCGKKLSSTDVYKTIIASADEATAHAILKKALDDVLPNYQAQWNRNLADTYIGLLSAAEMESIAVLREKSPHVSKMLIASNQAGAIMQKESAELFKSACDNVMQAVLQRSLQQPVQ